MEKNQYDLVILGGGPAGLSAALYAGRFKMKTVMFTEIIGGTLTWISAIENYPGFERISGFDLSQKLLKHAKQYGLEVRQETVTDVFKYDSGCFRISTKSQTVKAKAVIFASGTKVRKLGVPGEEKFSGRGVHYCAVCDGYFYKNKTMAVIGGSDSAAQEALLLSDLAKKVYIIYRRDRLRAEPINRERVEKNPKIEIITNNNIKEIKGDKSVKSVLLDNPYKGSKELKLDGLFVEIGRIPLSDLAKKMGVKTNDIGEIITDKESKTNISGVFAAGDIVDSCFKQIITGAANSVIAAYSAYKYVNETEIIFETGE